MLGKQPTDCQDSSAQQIMKASHIDAVRLAYRFMTGRLSWLKTSHVWSVWSYSYWKVLEGKKVYCQKRLYYYCPLLHSCCGPTSMIALNCCCLIRQRIPCRRLLKCRIILMLITNEYSKRDACALRSSKRGVGVTTNSQNL